MTYRKTGLECTRVKFSDIQKNEMSTDRGGQGDRVMKCPLLLLFLFDLTVLEG